MAGLHFTLFGYKRHENLGATDARLGLVLVFLDVINGVLNGLNLRRGLV